MKVYLVEVWDDKGAMTSHYEAKLPNDKAVKELNSFLKKHHAHVVLTPVPPKPKPIFAKRRRRSS